MHTDKIYAIGDIHGCYDTLVELFDLLDPEIPIIFLGDIVNRGPKSLETIRFVKSLGDRARLILGNHEMSLLATAADHGKQHRLDTMQCILDEPDAKEIINWLRKQYLLLQWNEYTFVHGAINPAWTLEKAKALAEEVQTHLRNKGWKKYLKEMYGKDQWDDNLTNPARMRAILNGFTRIRMVDENGIPEFKMKEGIDKIPPGFMPWFEVPCRKTQNDTIVFGHWSTLGLVQQPNVICLDTGCLWGGALTAMEFPCRKVITVKSPQYLDPLAC